MNYQNWFWMYMFLAVFLSAITFNFKKLSARNIQSFQSAVMIHQIHYFVIYLQNWYLLIGRLLPMAMFSLFYPYTWSKPTTDSHLRYNILARRDKSATIDFPSLYSGHLSWLFSGIWATYSCIQTTPGHGCSRVRAKARLYKVKGTLKEL